MTALEAVTSVDEEKAKLEAEAEKLVELPDDPDAQIRLEDIYERCARLCPFLIPMKAEEHRWFSPVSSRECDMVFWNCNHPCVQILRLFPVFPSDPRLTSWVVVATFRYMAEKTFAKSASISSCDDQHCCSNKE